MQTSVSKYLRTSAIVLSLGLASAVQAQVVIGSWQTSSDDGWIDWGNQGVGLFDASNAGKYEIAVGAVPGYAQSLQINASGWNQNLSIKLQNQGYVGDFMNNQLLSFTFSVPAATDGGFAEFFELAINSQGGGWSPQPFDARWSSTGDNSNNNGTQPRFFFWDGSPVQSQRVTLDYSALLPSLPENPGWVELIFAFNNGSGAPGYYYINEVTLSPIPEPSTFALLGLGAAGLVAIRRRLNR